MKIDNQKLYLKWTWEARKENFQPYVTQHTVDHNQKRLSYISDYK